MKLLWEKIYFRRFDEGLFMISPNSQVVIVHYDMPQPGEE